jgi:hypothetical protein
LPRPRPRRLEPAWTTGPVIVVHQLSDGRAFPLDSNPGFDNFPGFDREQSLKRDCSAAETDPKRALLTPVLKLLK